MSHTESVLTFDCQGERLVGILAAPAVAGSDLGVVVIVGGPQYRAGSHRQFVLLSRHLAEHGLPTLRFDYRGMGDSEGQARDFLAIEADIAAAIDALQAARPELRRVVLWGLCDAASAALLYVQARADARVSSLVLANPWVRSATSLAQAQVRHYYWRRLRQGDFWSKLLRGGVGLRAVGELGRKLHLAARTSSNPAPESFQDRMAAGLRGFKGRVLLILSGEDLTAQEFKQQAAASPAWQGLLLRPNVKRLEIPAADHTFSDSSHAAEVNIATTSWILERHDQR